MLVKIIMLAIAVCSVLLVILALQETMGGDWTVIAQKIAPTTVALVLFAVVVAGIYEYTQKK